jgi:hypothetical protein
MFYYVSINMRPPSGSVGRKIIGVKIGTLAGARLSRVLTNYLWNARHARTSGGGSRLRGNDKRFGGVKEIPASAGID